jgi:hypothetical protein
MSDLQQVMVKLILDALLSTNLSIESFMIMAISESAESPLPRSFLNGGVGVTVSNWITYYWNTIEGNEFDLVGALPAPVGAQATTTSFPAYKA